MPGSSTFFKLDRKIFNSNIWLQPVELRLFIYLIGQARFHEKPNTKYKKKGVIINRGQYLRSYRNLQKDLEYMENNAVKKYPLSRIKRAIDRLKKQGSLKTEETTLGTLFTIVNYCQYQGSYKNEREARNADGTGLERRWNNTKNVKNDKNEKNKDIVLQIKIGEIYNSIPDDWLELFRNYINIYRLKNKTREITPNRHYNLLNELYQIFSNMKFTFDQQEYEINKAIFKHGIEEIINKEVDNLNYAKKVWISEKEKEKKAKKPVKERPREELEKDGYI
jgi:hypothetical protein